MPLDMFVTLVAVFATIALVSGSLASMLLSRTAPEVKRLRRAERIAEAAGAAPPIADGLPVQPRAFKPLLKATRDQSRLRRRLATAGWDRPNAPALYTAAQMALIVVCGLVPLVGLGVGRGGILALLAAIIGGMMPGVVVSRRVMEHKRRIQNGLPDALDLLVVCVEAGSSLDQAILRTSEELEIALPAIGHELATVATEIRAGKPRMDAFLDLANRTKLDDVRALVAMLIQTDRFGTSIAQALRTHAETLRTKRRQIAEERAGKVGVKLVFPLVLCLMPSLYVVCLGPVAVRMYRAFY